MTQKLSPAARRAKAARDKAYAMSEWGKKKKRDAQKKDCPEDTTMTIVLKSVYQHQKTELEVTVELKTKQHKANMAINQQK